MINQLRPGGLFYISGRIGDAHDLCKRHHYSGRMCIDPAVRAVMTAHKPGGLFGDQGQAVAACVIIEPSTIWTEPVWELHRLVAVPMWGGSLTSLIAETMRYIKSRGKMDLIVSYADSMQNHHGGVYQAASWRYSHTLAPRMEGIMLGEQFIPNRTISHIWGTQSIPKLREIGIDAVKRVNDGKHLYWRALTRSGEKKAARLGLKDAPYPKPAHVVVSDGV